MIVVRDIVKTYPGASRPVIDHLSLDVPEGLTVVLLGSSGCGKTTLLKMIARQIEPTSGSIEVDGVDIRQQPKVEFRRKIGYVFQQQSLFPHMSIAENISLPLRIEGGGKAAGIERANELLEAVGLNPVKYRNRYPHELSGGQQQRVGVARALALQPRYLLMDEPFGALDNITRKSMQEELKRIREQFHVSILLVTHDIVEAVNLGDYIAVMNAGRIEQLGAGEDIVQNPATPFVKDLIARPFRELMRLSDRMLPS